VSGGARVSAELAALELTDSDGRTRRLDEAWAARSAALVFIRHFG
jgi:hypothetical protein